MNRKASFYGHQRSPCSQETSDPASSPPVAALPAAIRVPCPVVVLQNPFFSLEVIIQKPWEACCVRQYLK